MIYELELLDEPIAAAKRDVKSPIGKMYLASVELAVVNLKKATTPPDAAGWAQFLRAVREALASALKAEKERAEGILDDLDKRSRERDEALEEFDSIVPREGRSLQ